MKNIHPLFAAALLVLGTSALAAEPGITHPTVPADARQYVPAGAPPDPKVVVRWDFFRDYSKATELLRQMVKAHPDRCKLESLGKSYGGREMWLVTITNPATGKPESKPAMWVDAGIHANEIQTTDVALYTIWYLLEMDGHNAVVTDLLKRRVFYFVPMMSPDSRDAHFYEPNNTHSPRGGQRPVAMDEDGRADPVPQDLDGDGNITQMRVADPNGKWKPHPDFPELMVRVKEGEKGSYTLLGDEGVEDEGEARGHRRGSYDPNRDWPWIWQPNYVQHGAIRYPLWVGENRMVADFITEHPNIGGAATFHNAAGEIIRSPGAPNDAAMDGNDVRVFDSIGHKGELILPGYKYIELRSGLYPGYGVEMDWFYSMRGAVAYTVECYSPFNMFRRASEGLLGSDEDLHLFNKYLLMGDAFVPWHEVMHPKYGKIEVGGLKKNYVRQPPSFLVEEECHRNMAFILEEASRLAEVKVQSVTVKDLPGGVRQVTAIIENRGLVPTHLAADSRHHITPPDVVTLGGENLKVITALTSHDPFFEESNEQKRHPERVHLDNVPGEGVVYVRWLTTGPGPRTVTVHSVKGGGDSMSVVDGAK